jgi:UDP-2,3-diacylglucosamine hydrolase
MILGFLDSIIGKYDMLILAGDIFDLWFDWNYTIIKQYFPLLVKLYEISQNDCRIIHISGNHDFWFGNFLPEYLNIQLEDESFFIETDNKKILVCHGDTHTVNDLRYHVFRRIIRFPFTKRIFSLLHPDLALGLGSKLSRSSRARKDPPPMRRKKNSGLHCFARNQIRRGLADFVIMGHSHHPEMVAMEGGYYVNSGEWISQYSYVEIISGEIFLKHYNINKGDTA